jgi:ribonuclease D
VFDTQLAAAVLGYSHQISYADLVQQVTGVQLEKKHTRANWMRRPLSRDELDYAMDDVRYLLAVYQELDGRLESTGRRAWIARDLQAMSDTDNYRVDLDQLWKRLRGVQKLKGEKLQIASDLCRWREQQAQQQNRPRRWIMKDDVIIEIARQQPADTGALSRIPELSDKSVKRHGEKLLKIVSAAGRIDAATLATRKDIDNLILNQKSSRLTQGWRFVMVGEQLLEFIHGQSVISVQDQAIKLEPR